MKFSCAPGFKLTKSAVNFKHADSVVARPCNLHYGLIVNFEVRTLKTGPSNLARSGPWIDTASLIMSLAKEEFNEQCIEFATKCLNLSDEWSVVIEKFGVTSKLDLSQKNLNVPVDSNLMLVNKEVKTTSCNKLRTFEYNVVYSESYRVPVMHFNVSEQDGSYVNFEEIANIVFNTEPEDLTEVVNQVEHPIFFRPFFIIHPCRTADFMRDHQITGPKNYLLCWLSTVGTLIGLKLDLRLANTLIQ